MPLNKATRKKSLKNLKFNLSLILKAHWNIK